MTGTPCVKRWCSKSRSKQLCEDDSCRYAHSDYLPVPEEPFTIADYLILPGELRQYLADGKRMREWWICNRPTDWVGFHENVKERQKQARTEFDRYVREGKGTLETLGAYCGESCGDI